MAQILQSRPSIGEQFATGLGQGLQMLAQQKLQDFQQRAEQERGMAGLQALGYSPEEAHSISQLPPQLQQLAVKDRLKTSQMAPLMSQLESMYGLGQPEGAGAGFIPPTETPAEGIPTEKLPSGELAAPSMPQEEAQAALAQAAPAKAVPAKAVPAKAVPARKKKISTLTQAEKSQILASAMTGDPRAISKTVRDIESSRQKESQFERRLKFDQKKEDSATKRALTKEDKIEQREINKETLPFYEKTLKEAKSARDNEMRLKRITTLNQKGKLGLPILNSVIKGITKGIFGAGLDLTFMMTADAQELDKLSTDFLKNVKDIFGARITDNEIKQFLKTVPSLSQSKEGRERIIRNMSHFNDASKARINAMNSIIKENKGLRPRNLEAKVDERAEKELDAISDKFAVGKTGRSGSAISELQTRAGIKY